jgi:electron transport complex protein RnfA
MLTNNVLVVYFLGLCSFFGVTNKLSVAWSMSVAVILVTFIASQLAYVIDIVTTLIQVEHLRNLAKIAVIASTVQIIDIVMKSSMSGMHKAFGIYLALITTNCLVFGVAVIQTSKGYSYTECISYSLGAGFGYTLMMMIMAGLRVRLELSNPPELMKGAVLSLIIACYLSFLMQGFNGLGN